MIRRFVAPFLCLVIITLLSFDVAAQSEEDKAMANEYMFLAEEIMKATRAEDQALEMYELAANTDPTNLKANYMAGKYYLLTGVNKSRSTKYFLRVFKQDPSYRFDMPYLIGQGYQYGLDVDSAIYFYETYKNRLITDRNYRGKDKISLGEVDRRLYECNNTKEFIANPAHYSIVNVGKQINSEWMDYAPVLNEDETMMVFTSRRQDGNLSEDVDLDNHYFEDIFISRKENGKWKRAKNIGDAINTPFHGANLALSADGTQLYLYRDDNGGDILFSELKKDGKTWTTPKPLNENVNSSFSENAFSISPDKSIAFFSSNRPGGNGGYDIYVTKKDRRGNWGKAVNLGPVINTDSDEESPFIDYDGKTLYFSSRGRKGMGGHDIFQAEYDSINKEWTEPVNLGYPINTPDNDIFFVSTKDGQRGYYASVRTDGLGYLDIYMVTVPDLSADNKENKPEEKKKPEVKEPEPQKEPEIELAKNEEPKEPKEDPIPIENGSQFGNAHLKQVEEGDLIKPVILLLKVEDYDTGLAMDAKVSLRTVDDKVEMPVQKVGGGLYEIESRYKKKREFMLSIEKEGYMFRNFKISLPEAKNEEQRVNRRVEMERLRKNFSTVLRNIYFDFDKATFTIDSYNELNKLEKLMHENSKIIVEISGHTDNIGGKVYNKNLSQKRASAVVGYLTNKGIDRRRLKVVGYGQERPLASNDDEKDGRELNRRVEFKVLEGPL